MLKKLSEKEIADIEAIALELQDQEVDL